MIQSNGFGAWAAVLGVLLALVGTPPAANAQAPDLSDTVLHVARYKGGFADLRQVTRAAGIVSSPYKVEYHEFATASQIIEAINAGAIDFGLSSELGPIFGAVGQTDARVVAVLHGNANDQALLLPPGSSIQTLADLKGKRVGFQRASSAHYGLLRMLKSVGLTIDDIKPANLGLSEARAAFEKGSIDAWVAYGFSVPVTITATGARVLTYGAGYTSGNYVMLSGKATLSDPRRRAALGYYITDLARAYEWESSHPHEWVELWSQEIGIPVAPLAAIVANASQPDRLGLVDEPSIAAQQDVADLLAAAGLTPHRVDVRPLWDSAFDSSFSRGRP
jgi:sulfonate transport system substrate-binding protein